MNSILIKLAERRSALVTLSAIQRRDLARAFEPWRTPLNLADEGLSVLRLIARYKVLVTGVMVFVAVAKPQWALSLLRNGWRLWRMVLAFRRGMNG